jgi:transcriptional regulator with XRE-family HTH domain
MVRRIGRRAPRRMFIREWREHRGLSQQQLADRLDTNKGAISKYENGKTRLDMVILADLAYALNVNEEDLFHHPDEPSADALLRDAPASLRASTLAFIETLKRTGS